MTNNLAINILIRVVVNAAALSFTAFLLPGITIADDVGTLFLVAIVFGIVNAIIKPIITILTCPFVILTLGLFIFVINGMMLMLTSTLMGDAFNVDSWGTAILGGIIMAITSIVLEAFLNAFNAPQNPNTDE